MKITIELDLPEGQAIPTAAEIARLTDPNWISDWWHISDVREQYEGDQEYYDLSDAQCQRVLEIMKERKDACIGFNWDYVAECIESMYEEQV